ncbi:unnamed protein product, partial [marine sediment metagenome]
VFSNLTDKDLTVDYIEVIFSMGVILSMPLCNFP